MDKNRGYPGSRSFAIPDKAEGFDSLSFPWAKQVRPAEFSLNSAVIDGYQAESFRNLSGERIGRQVRCKIRQGCQLHRLVIGSSIDCAMERQAAGDYLAKLVP